MMKLIAFSCLLALAAARPQKPNEATILAQQNDVGFDGTFKYSFETSDGTRSDAQGQLRQVGQDAGQAISGSYSHKTPEGVDVALSYIADENGYQPQGAHLPTPPPIPEAIARALEYIRSLPPTPEAPRGAGRRRR